MRCPWCAAPDTRVVDSRAAEDGCAIRRRRECASCQSRFTTYERMEEVPLVVVKRSGEREPFDRAKIVGGLRAATKGRPVTDDDLLRVAAEVEEAVRLDGPEVPSAVVGMAVLDRLRHLDQVAYLRFASVYKNFDDAADFQRELTLLAKTSEPKPARSSRA